MHMYKRFNKILFPRNDHDDYLHSIYTLFRKPAFFKVIIKMDSNLQKIYNL